MEEVQKDVPKDIKLRPMSCEINPLTRTDGSMLFSQGGTCIIGSMLGPAEVKSQYLLYDRARVECTYRSKGGQPTVTDKIRENLIRDACEAALLATLHPRTLISIQLQELDDRGGLNACAINTACLALLIGGVPLKYTVAAVCCAVNKAGEILVDPDFGSTMDCNTFFTFAFDALDKDIITFHSVGSFKMQHFNDAYQKCREASSKIFDFYRKVMTDFHIEDVRKFRIPSIRKRPEQDSNIQQSMEVEQDVQ